jgi:hypothetical protein
MSFRCTPPPTNIFLSLTLTPSLPFVHQNEVSLDKAEVEELIKQATRPHVKELLQELHRHM